MHQPNKNLSRRKDTKGQKSKGICIPLLMMAFLCAIIVFCFHQATEFDNYSSAAAAVGSLGGGQSQKLSPFFSTKPLTKSLHSKFKLWTEMTPHEQEIAMDYVGQYMKKYGSIIKPAGKNGNQLKNLKQGSCEFDKKKLVPQDILFVDQSLSSRVILSVLVLMMIHHGTEKLQMCGDAVVLQEILPCIILVRYIQV